MLGKLFRSKILESVNLNVGSETTFIVLIHWTLILRPIRTINNCTSLKYLFERKRSCHLLPKGISEPKSFLTEGRQKQGKNELLTYDIQTISTKCSTFLNSGSPVTKIALCSTAEARAKQSA